MPSKVWVAGEEVLASDWNNYIQEQVVSTFSSAAARTAALPAPKNGQMTWLIDTKRLDVWNGTAWAPASVGSRIAYEVTAGADVTTGQTVEVVSAPFTLAATRLCRLETHAGYAIVGGGGATGAVSAALGFDHARVIRTATSYDPPLNSGWWGSGSTWASLAAGAHTADVAIVNASTRTARVTAGTVYVAVQDYG
jgi:hypothetical protein